MNKPYVSAEHINSLFYHQPRKKRRILTWPLISAGILMALAIFFFINAPAFTQQLGFWWSSDIGNVVTSPQNAQIITQTVPSSQPSDNTITTQQSPSIVAQPPIDPAKLRDNTLYIPKIKLSAPIIWDVTGGGDLNADMLNALRNGVVRYPKTALPDQVGNVFLTGHSSNYWWEKGKYKTVFALLDRLVVGDAIYVKYQNTLYIYSVAGRKVVQPTETMVLDPTSTPTLSLMTCTPTGTALRRLVVTANLISPTVNKAQTTAPTAQNLGNTR